MSSLAPLPAPHLNAEMLNISFKDVLGISRNHSCPASRIPELLKQDIWFWPGYADFCLRSRFVAHTS